MNLRATRGSGPLAQARAAIRECVGNTVRHAHAHHLTITITDDGTPDTTARSGLRNFTGRVHQAAGSCHLTSPDTGDTRLAWTAPRTPTNQAPATP